MVTPFNKTTGSSSATEHGFTLVELVMAVAIISGAFLTILDLRVKALDDAFQYNSQRLVNRLARQKLDEVAFGLEENTSGNLEVPGRDSVGDWPWNVQIFNESTTDIGPRVLRIDLTLEYPSVYGNNGLDSNSDSGEELESVTLSTRVITQEGDALFEYASQLVDMTSEGSF
jgi:prepilin-type N-terminal cleavage/methylation domain-containing protein